MALIFVAGIIPLCVLFYQFHTQHVEFSDSPQAKHAFSFISIITVIHILLGGIALYLLAFGRKKYLKERSSQETTDVPKQTDFTNEATEQKIDSLAIANRLVKELKQKKKLQFNSFFNSLVNQLNGSLATGYLLKDNELVKEATYGYVDENNQKYTLGEGLPGEVAKNGEPLIIKEVPENYIQVKSGLGDATPTSLWIYPLKKNGKVVGVIEIAGFMPYQAYHSELIDSYTELVWEELEENKQ